MSKVAGFVLGLFAMPIAACALVMAWPDLHGSIDVPAHDVLFLRPGDAAFRHLPLHGAPLQPDVAMLEDGSLYVTGDPSERFDPATSAFVVTDKRWNELQLQTPPKMPISGTSWLVGPHVFVGVARPKDGSPQTLATAVGLNGIWKIGPTFPENDLIYDVARFDDGTLAFGAQGHRIFIARPGDDAFHDAKVDAELPNGDLWVFGHGLLHVVLDNSVSPPRLETRIIDLETQHVSLGPSEPFVVGDKLRMTSGAAGGGVIIALGRAKQAYDAKKLPQNLAGGGLLLAEILGLAIYFARTKDRPNGLKWFGIGAGGVIGLGGVGMGLLVWIFSGVHW